MNKVTFLLTAFMILVLGSCQEAPYAGDFQETPSKIKAFDLVYKVDDGVVARLQAFNDSLFFNRIAVSSTNGISSRPWVQVALADCHGFCEGGSLGWMFGSVFGPQVGLASTLLMGTLVGADRSARAASPSNFTNSNSYNECISAFIKMKEEVSDYTPYYPSIITLRLPKGKQDLKISGARHNLILDNIRNKRFSATTLKDAYATGIITKDEYTILADEQTRSYFNNIDNGTQQPSFDMGEKSNAIESLYQQAIQNSANSYEDVGTISNRYITEVYSSTELDSTEKDNLVSSFCVLTSSVEYWKAFDAK